MKKYLLSLAAALMLLFAIIPSAHADTVVNLGSYSAGCEMSMPISDNVSEITYDLSAIPSGCAIKIIDGKLCLAGNPESAGSYSFDIYAGGELYTVYVDIIPYTPFVVISGDKTCTKDSSMILSVSADCWDRGVLSYQWYVNTERSVIGGNPIPGATSSTVTADTGTAGTKYYYCNVTNNNNGIMVNVYSDAAAVTVTEPEVSGIFIDREPDKMQYRPGETVDTTGLVLKLYYADGTSSTVTSDYTVTPRVITEDTKGIWITYKGKEAYLQLRVEEKLSLVIYTMPNRTEYTVGDLLETNGLAIKVMAGDSVKDILSTGFSCEPMLFNNPGAQIVTVKYKDASCNFTVNVKEKTPDSLSVYTLPAKTEYYVGDTADFSGLVLSVKSGDKSTLVTNDFTASPMSFSTAGTQKITVKYNNLECVFSVNVLEKPAQTAAPTASPMPGSEEPTDTPRPSSSNTSASRGPGMDVHRMLVVFIVILAFLALVILCLYIYVARVKNIDDSALGKLIERLKNLRDDD